MRAIIEDFTSNLNRADPSNPLLQRPNVLITPQQRVYTHVWSPRQCIVWDNRCTLHRRDSFDPQARRLMHRTQIKASRERA